MTYRKFVILGLFPVFLFLFSCSTDSTDTIVIADFDSGSFGEWALEGTAFGEELSGGKGTHRMVGYLGDGFASSININNEPTTGMLTSPPFIIERNSIHFLIGAHSSHFLDGTMANPDDLAMHLMVDGKVVLTKIPDEFKAMHCPKRTIQGLRYSAMEEGS